MIYNYLWDLFSITFVVLGWRKLLLNKYYCKMSDMDKGVSFKHLNEDVLLWMI